MHYSHLSKCMHTSGVEYEPIICRLLFYCCIIMVPKTYNIGLYIVKKGKIELDRIGARLPPSVTATAPSTPYYVYICVQGISKILRVCAYNTRLEN